MLIPGKGMGVLQNSKKFRVRVESVLEVTEAPAIVARAHRTYTSSGYGYECRTELTEVAVRVIPGKLARVRFCTYRTEHKCP